MDGAAPEKARRLTVAATGRDDYCASEDDARRAPAAATTATAISQIRQLDGDDGRLTAGELPSSRCQPSAPADGLSTGQLEMELLTKP